MPLTADQIGVLSLTFLYFAGFVGVVHVVRDPFRQWAWATAGAVLYIGLMWMGGLMIRLC